MLLHYARARDLCPFSFVPCQLLRFHERLRKEYLLPIQRRDEARALDIGCAVGRFTFELARVVGQALGIDNSKSFILAARGMADRRRVVLSLKESGEQFSSHRLDLPVALHRARVEFQVGDALDLEAFPDHKFDVVSAVNLIDRLPSPRRFLRQVSRLLPPGGQLLITSPFTWLPDTLEPKEWFASEDLPSLMAPEFRLVRHGDLPFLIREHRRKFQLVVAEVFTFRKVAEANGPSLSRVRLPARSRSPEAPSVPP